MRVVYHINSLDTVYAARFIYEGYKAAFTDLGHQFRPYTAGDDLRQLLDEFQPDIFITGLNSYSLKYLNLDVLSAQRRKGMVLFSLLSPWEPVNEQYGGTGLKHDRKLVDLIKRGLVGDVFFHWMEQDSPFMEGFQKETGYPFYTIILAADKTCYYPEYDARYQSDIAYVGSYLPEKRVFIAKHLTPLRDRYQVRLYGSDWTLGDRCIGHLQRVGQYFNIEQLARLRRLQLPLDDERKVYSSARVSLNIHEERQRQSGSDFNERTLKIIASGGFEICDNVAVIRRYFNETELVIGENTADWFEKIDYYVRNPDKRLPIIAAGQKKVLTEHTYHNRVAQILDIHRAFRGGR